MHITFVSIFPEIFTSFLDTSLIAKAQKKNILSFTLVNPRNFCTDKHQQVDDVIYGGGNGMLLKAEPFIQAVESVFDSKQRTNIVFLTPSKTIFDQQRAHHYAQSCQHLILVCGRYEGIDYRFVEYFTKKYPDYFTCVSMGQFVTLGGEVPAMTMCEAIVRLIPGVIKEENSRIDESYAPDHAMQNLEYPQYTRPECVRGINVPDVLLSGHHAKIKAWREGKSGRI